MTKVFLFLLFVLLVPSAASQPKDPAMKIGEKFTFDSRDP